MLHRMPDHVCVEMAPFAGVDLNRRRPGRADALGVHGGLLIALDHGKWQLAFQLGDRIGKQRGLPRSRA